MKKNKSKKTLFQIIGSTFIILTGLFVMFTISNNITGNVIGNSGSINLLDIAIVFWGFLIIVAGLWIISTKDFKKSIFKN